jgi:type 1 fimbria pilin
MKRKIILISALALMLFVMPPAISSVHAASPITATGTVTAGTYTFTGERTADGNTFVTGVFDADTFSGTFSGTAPNIFRLILNPSGLNVQIYFTFTGTVNGVSGTCVIKFQGNGAGIGMPIKGTWVILSGTGGLANLHGELSVEGTAGVILYYTGKIHFDP